MPELSTIADKVRSKNAGPFWLTIDILCGSDDSFNRSAKGPTVRPTAAAARPARGMASQKGMCHWLPVTATV